MAELRFRVPAEAGGRLGLSLRFPSTDRPHARRLSEGRLESRELVRVFVVLSAWSVDLSVLAIATAAAAYFRYGNVVAGSGSVLFLMMLPAYLFAAYTFDAYSLGTLKRWTRSSFRANIALLTAVGFAFTAAYALHV